MPNAVYNNVIQAMEELKSLISSLPEASHQRLELQDKRNALRTERDRLINVGLDEGSTEYLAATTALEGGIAEIRAAINDNSRIANVINRMSQVVQAVSSVIPAGA